MITVTIRECKTNGRTWTHRARTDDPDIAVDRAIQKHWPGCFLWADSGLGKSYGQIMMPLSCGSNTSMTGRIRVDVAER